MHLETDCEGDAQCPAVRRADQPPRCATAYLGTTTNPHNTALTSGGSSGGEGALVAFKGSCLGIGTDIGGSIRNPAGK